MKFLTISLLIVSIWQTASSFETRKLSWKHETLDEPSGMFPLGKESFFKYLTKWNSSWSESTESSQELYHQESPSYENENHEDEEEIEDEENISSENSWLGSDLPEIEERIDNGIELIEQDTEFDNIFQASTNDSSMILSDMTICLTNYNLMDCIKMFMLIRVKRVVLELERTNSTGVDFRFLNGLVNFRWTNESYVERGELRGVGLTEELHYFVHRLFRSRSLQIHLTPSLGVEFRPRLADPKGDLCFSAKLMRDTYSEESSVEETRKKADDKKKNKKKGGFSMMPMMMIPQMIMMGMMPFALANLKSMVMNAFMMNSMALNSAIFMTIRNLVFGPRKGEKVKYVNYGYNKKVVEKKPTLVLHSPAAFVTKPVKNYPPYMPPNLDVYDNPNSYHYDKAPTNRRKNLQRVEQKPQPTNYETYPPYSPHAVNSLQPEYQHFDQPNKVDAPISYLNNNQYLQPSDSTQVTKSQSFSYDLNEPKTSYESYNDPYSTVNRGNSRIDYDKYSYSSKFSDEVRENDSKHNYYSNHRPQS